MRAKDPQRAQIEALLPHKETSESSRNVLQIEFRTGFAYDGVTAAL
jgi:hypothetical protein